MKLFPEGKSRMLSATALAAAVGCLIMAGRSFVDLVDFLYFYSSASFFPALAHAKLPVDMPPFAAFLAGHMRLSFYFSFFFWLSGGVLAAGVWRRYEWARRGAVPMCYILALAGGLLLFMPWLVVPQPLVYGDIQLAPEFNDAVRAASFVVRMTSFLGGGMCLWWALALDRGAARKEFGGKV